MNRWARRDSVTFPRSRRWEVGRGTSALCWAPPPPGAAQGFPVNRRASLGSGRGTSRCGCIFHQRWLNPPPPPRAAPTPTLHPARRPPGVGSDRCVRHSPCPHRSQSGRRNDLAQNESNGHCDIWHHPVKDASAQRKRALIFQSPVKESERQTHALWLKALTFH